MSERRRRSQAALERVALLSYGLPYTPARVTRLLRAPSLEDAVRDRTVLVTGASSGIGRAAATRLAAAGAAVLLVARRRDALEEAAGEISRAGGVAHVHPCDLSDPDAVEALVAEVLGEHARVDVLINGAGHSIRRDIARSTDRIADYERTMQLNFFGALRLTLGLLETMEARGFGHVINLSTLGLATSTPRFSAYLSSKGALEAFSRCLAAERRGAGIHVTTIHMPLVRTPMIEPTRSYRSAPALTADEAADWVAEAVRTRPARMSPRAASAFELAWVAAPEGLERAMHTAYDLTRGGAERDDERSQVDGGLRRALIAGVGRAFRVRL